jgi:hypothetical protein
MSLEKTLNDLRDMNFILLSVLKEDQRNNIGSNGTCLKTVEIIQAIKSEKIHRSKEREDKEKVIDFRNIKKGDSIVRAMVSIKY